MAIISRLIEGVENDVLHYVRVYPINLKDCAQSELDGQVVSVIPCAFPREPSEYGLLETITTAATWTAPADGWYQIELFGASGNGAKGASGYHSDYEVPAGYTVDNLAAAAGAGGGGGAVAVSHVKLSKGNTIKLTNIAIGSTATVHIVSSMEDYSDMLCVSGGNATSPSRQDNGNTCIYTEDLYYGTVGRGGTASGGNVSNVNGKNGKQGDYGYIRSNWQAETYAGGSGGAPAIEGGNTGGSGGSATLTPNSVQDLVIDTFGAAGSGKTAFMKISAGDTNVA